MKKYAVLLSIFLSGVTFFAQTKFKPDLLAQSATENLHTKNDTLKILAVMVEFQPDLYDATYGDGTFGSIYTGENRTRTDILDPLPHDKTYFENHLRFAKNYFEKESGGKLNIVYYVLPGVVTLDKTMRNYSPEVNSDDVSRIADLTKEAWEKAYAQNPDFDFGAYDMFAVFHAGVGRDVSVPGSLGLERDIPSVYFGLNQYKQIYGEDFDGISVGNFKITNSAVLPETESREVVGLTGSMLIELTINGLLASMVGSYLGLPDLYDTETGYSAIGRFGLMDGQAIFAYGGTFPPSLSPFEKIFLGWLEPAEINSPNRVSLVAAQIANENETTVAKIPISKTEYFLVQVRRRDANADGAKIHYVDETGTTRQVVFEEGDDGFYNYDVSALQGVIVNVDEFDWALPGEGIVIWHIDENVVNANLESNTVNNDENHRGVEVVEADGIKDIGRTFYDIFGDLVIGEGTQYDFWYADNPSHYYENAFTPDTKPNSNSYSGAPSGIYILDISALANEMSFNVDFQGEIETVKTFRLPESKTPEFFAASSNGAAVFGVQSGRDVFIYDFNGNLLKRLDNFSDVDFLLIYDGDDDYRVIGVTNNAVSAYSSATDTAVILANFNMPIKKIFQNDEVGGNSAAYYVLASGNDSSYVKGFGADYNVDYEFPFAGNDVLMNNGAALIIGDNYFVLSSEEEPHNTQNNILKAAHALSYFTNLPNSEISALIFLEENNLFEIYDISRDVRLYASFNAEGNEQIKDFSLSRDDNGAIYITYAADGKLYAYNLNGALADNFPVEADDSEINDFAKTYETDTAAKFVANANNGALYFGSFETASERNNPLFSVGSLCADKAKVTLAKHDEVLYLITSDCENNIYLLRKNENVARCLWNGKYANMGNAFSVVRANDTDYNVRNALVKAYNWPNPVSEGVTHFRVLTSDDANVNIKIFDMSGMKVDELNGYVNANMETDIVWNVRNLNSDVYFARVETTFSSGKKDFKIVKVAVVK